MDDNTRISELMDEIARLVEGAKAVPDGTVTAMERIREIQHELRHLVHGRS